MKPKLVARHPRLGLAIITITMIGVSSYLLEHSRQSNIEETTHALGIVLLGMCAFLAWCFWPVTRVESLGLFFEEPTDKQKIVHVRIWTALGTVLTVLLILKPAGGGESELPYYIILPYGMMAIVNKIPGLAFFCAVFQFPIYGWIIAHTWRENELTLGLMTVTIAHSGAMLLSALMAISK